MCTGQVNLLHCCSKKKDAMANCTRLFSSVWEQADMFLMSIQEEPRRMLEGYCMEMSNRA
jgi:hypothetical protein